MLVYARVLIRLQPEVCKCGCETSGNVRERGDVKSVRKW